jgi:hypothetical protein
VLFLFCYCCTYLYVLYLYDLFHILLLPITNLWIHGTYVCVCVCVCARIHACITLSSHSLGSLSYQFTFCIFNLQPIFRSHFNHKHYLVSTILQSTWKLQSDYTMIITYTCNPIKITPISPSEPSLHPLQTKTVTFPLIY